MSESYQQRLQQIRKRHPRAYEKWSDEDERLLTEMILAGSSVIDIAHTLQRQPSAIRSRLAKKNRIVVSSPDASPSTPIKPSLSSSNQPNENKSFPDNPEALTISFSLVWKAVLQKVGQVYLFPQPITSFMNHRYRWPAIYRWLIYQDIPEQASLMYIGSTKKLCPHRLDGYLHPGESVTNQRLSALFHDYINQGFIIGLEVLSSSNIAASDNYASTYHLRSQTRRLTLEELLIDYYKQQGFELLNQ